MNKSLTIEGTPKAQKRHKFGKGFVYDPSKKDKIQLLPLLRGRFGSLPSTKPVSVALAFYMPIPKSYSKKKKDALSGDDVPHIYKPDTDNMIKFYLDCLPFDDKVAYKVEAEKKYSSRPRVEIVIVY